jgi:plasmid stabilization system protein ParE
MARISWTPRARVGADEFVKRIGVDDPVGAVKWQSRIDRAARRIELFPESGSPVEDTPRPGLREVLVGPYRMIYSFEPATQVCRILFFVHGHRDLGNVIPSDDAT